MIGSAELHSRLYMFNVNESSRRQTQKIVEGKCSFSTLRSSNDSEIMLWHYFVGHPSLLYLKELFPSLLNQNSVDVTYEVCQLFKHVCNSYPHQTY